jgi:hypothetical protein
MHPGVIRAAAVIAVAMLLPIAVGAQPASASLEATGDFAIAGPVTAAVGAQRLSQPSAGNPNGGPLPDDVQPVDTSHPDIVVGGGSPAGCTSQAVVDAVAHGGVITFDCGPAPISIVMAETAKVVNTSQIVVLDGGNRVTLSGGGQRRILYMDTCDPAQVWTTSHCDDQDSPQLTLQHIGFTQGNSTGELSEGGGGGAVLARGGRVTVIDSTFTSNRCDSTGPDLGGGALRVLSQSHDLPVTIASSTFGGSGSLGNTCSNGAALSSIGVSWRIYNSLFVGNNAIGNGANPSRQGSPGGGSGGAIYLDGNRLTLDLVGSIVTDNTANEGGGAIFFVSNDRTGELRIAQSTLVRNISRGFQTAGFSGIFFLGLGAPQVSNSSIG